MKGTRDILPEEWYFRESVANKIISVIEKYGYRRVETPVMEYFEVLAKKSGEEIKEEIYYFKDKAGRELGLRFDMTVPIVRIISSRPDIPLPIRWYYYSRVWRYDEPQRGRYREFWQIGAELIGIKSLLGDIELLDMINSCFKEIGLEVKIYINDRRIVENLIKKLNLENKKDEIFRILDKKRKLSKEEFENRIKEIISDSSKAEKVILFSEISYDLDKAIEILVNDLNLDIYDLEKLSDLSKEINIYTNLIYSADIVRGLDYYTGLCYEIYSDEFNLSLGGGGRYDNLIYIYSGRNVPATGFALGFDRIITVLENKVNKVDYLPKIDYWIYYTKEEYYSLAMKIAKKLREKGYRVIVEITGRKLKDVLSRISGKARHLIIIGEKEIKNKEIYIKNLETREEKTVKINEIL